MKINKEINNNVLTLSLEGKLDTITSPELEKVIKEEIDNVTEIVMDFKKLEYVSSAGLRVLLSTQKQISTKGSMTIINVSEEIKQVFEITGFNDILHIE